MESLSNYDSEDEGDVSNSNTNTDKDLTRCGMEGDNYDAVQMDMSENPLNGSKAPSVQALSLGRSGGAPPASATTKLDSNPESVIKDSPHNSNEGSRSSSSPASALSSDDSESNEGDEEEKSNSVDGVPLPSTKTNEVLGTEKVEMASSKLEDQIRRDHEKRRECEKDRDRERENRNRDRDRVKVKDSDRDDRDRRKGPRRDDRHRSRSRDRRERHRSPERNEKLKSKERDEPRKSKDRRSSSRDRARRRDVDRRHAESRGREYDRKRFRSRSRSTDRHKPGNDSRSSSSSGGSRGDARSRDVKVPPSGSHRGSRSRSKSQERERSRAGGGDSRKFYLEKKIDRKMNVLERMGIELKAEAKSSTGTITPQMLVQRTMEQEAALVKKTTGVELPSYYNAAAVNPQRLVDQIQKRKLLWGSKKDDANKPAAQQPSASNKWQGATFAQDQDGKLTAKFNRLMGIKQAPTAAPNPAGAPATGSEIIKKQEEMFHNMESQYEVARLATHTHRGLGLGFGTFQPR